MMLLNRAIACEIIRVVVFLKYKMNFLTEETGKASTFQEGIIND